MPPRGPLATLLLMRCVSSHTDATQATFFLCFTSGQLAPTKLCAIGATGSRPHCAWAHVLRPKCVAHEALVRIHFIMCLCRSNCIALGACTRGDCRSVTLCPPCVPLVRRRGNYKLLVNRFAHSARPGWWIDGLIEWWIDWWTDC